MKRSSVFSFYLLVGALITALGYYFDAYLGIWRQGIVGVLLLSIGYLLFVNYKVNSVKKKSLPIDRISVSVTAALMLAAGILFSVALRLLFAGVFSVGLIAHSTEGLMVRITATVLLPSICAMTLAFRIVPSICPCDSLFVRVLLNGICFLPFCTEWVYMPAAFVLGLIFGICDRFLSSNSGIEIFAAYFALMFYDTLSISVGRVDFGLQMDHVISFLLIALSVGLMLTYLALRTLRERKFRLAEFLTMFLLAVMILLLGIAI